MLVCISTHPTSYPLAHPPVKRLSLQHLPTSQLTALHSKAPQVPEALQDKLAIMWRCAENEERICCSPGCCSPRPLLLVSTRLSLQAFYTHHASDSSFVLFNADMYLVWQVRFHLRL